MTTEPETGSVTMLRKPATPPADSQTSQTVAPNVTEPAAATAPNVVAQMSPPDVPAPGLLKKVTRSKILWSGAAAVALLGIGAAVLHVVPSRTPAQHAVPAAKTVAIAPADINSSALTPPDLGTPPTPAAKQTQAANASKLTPATTSSPAQTTTQPVEAPSAQTAAEEVPPDTRVDHPATRTTTSAEDQLFMEMSHKLTEMTNRIDTLEQKLDANQHALHDQLVSGLGTVGGRLDELRHREDTLEANQTAHTALTPAAPTTAPVSAPAASTSHKAAEPAPTHRAHTEAQPAERPVPRPHYTVQAGAPDIAILESPQGQPVRVQPGSTLDGWGAVTAITQSGSSWVVHTEHGNIR